MFGRFHRHLRKLAHRALNALEVRHFEIPDIDVFADALYDYAVTHLGMHLRYQAPGEPKPTPFERWARLDDDELLKVSRMSAEFAREHWTADYLERMRKRSSAGGRVSKRPPTKATSDALAALAALPSGLTRSEQAHALEVSESTVKRLARQLRDRAPEAPHMVPEETDKPTGAPSWWGAWETPGVITHRVQRPRKVFYPGEW